jgi:hypothetical protein
MIRVSFEITLKQHKLRCIFPVHNKELIKIAQVRRGNLNRQAFRSGKTFLCDIDLLRKFLLAGSSDKTLKLVIDPLYFLASPPEKQLAQLDLLILGSEWLTGPYSLGSLIALTH